MVGEVLSYCICCYRSIYGFEFTFLAAGKARMDYLHKAVHV